MLDQLRDTWAYQEILEEGRQEGLEKGKLEAFHQGILDVIQERFPDLVPLAQKQLEGVVDPEVLRRLVVKMSTAQTVQQATLPLLELHPGPGRRKNKE